MNRKEQQLKKDLGKLQVLHEKLRRDYKKLNQLKLEELLESIKEYDTVFLYDYRTAKKMKLQMTTADIEKMLLPHFRMSLDEEPKEPYHYGDKLIFHFAEGYSLVLEKYHGEYKTPTKKTVNKMEER